MQLLAITFVHGVIMNMMQCYARPEKENEVFWMLLDDEFFLI